MFKQRIQQDKNLEHLESHPHYTAYMLRFLRATMKHKKDRRVFQVDDALERLKQVMEWKTKYGISHDMEEPEGWEEFNQVYPYYDWLDTKAKVPVGIERFGVFHSHSVRNRYSETQWNQLCGYRMENVMRAIDEMSEQVGEEVPGYNVFADLRGASLWGIMRRFKFVKMLNDVGAKNYPELLNKIIIVNAPRFVNDLLRAAKAFVDPDTMRKFESHRGIAADIREKYDVRFLPQEYNGDKDVSIPIPLDARKRS